MNTAGRCQNDMQGAPVRPARAREAFRSIDEERRQQGGAAPAGKRRRRERRSKRSVSKTESTLCRIMVPDMERAEIKHESGMASGGKSTRY